MKVTLDLHPGFTARDVVGVVQVRAATPGTETMSEQVVVVPGSELKSRTTKVPNERTATGPDLMAYRARRA
jgi:hypothetical protein